MFFFDVNPVSHLSEGRIQVCCMYKCHSVPHILSNLLYVLGQLRSDTNLHPWRFNLYLIHLFREAVFLNLIALITSPKIFVFIE